MAKVESSTNISDVFAKKYVDKKPSNENFEAFKNMYRDPK